MEKLICWFKGHNWGKLKKERGWTTENVRKHRHWKYCTNYKRTCRRCNAKEYYANSSY